MQHLSSTNSTLKKENTDSKTALAEHQTEHQNCMASFATKCTSYEREIGKHLCLECRIVECTISVAFWRVVRSYLNVPAHTMWFITSPVASNLWPYTSPLIVHLVFAASHKGAMKEKEAAYQTNLEQLEQDHQAALEALTQKCLTLEEELGKWY